MSLSGSDGEYDDDMEHDSDRELQDAFARGEIKPGLNIESKPKKVFTNNVPALRLRLRELQRSQQLDWIERLDLTTGLAPMAPEMAILEAEREQEKESGRPKLAKALDPTLDDFKREMNFHRQAQAAVVEGIERLHKLGIVTKRPDDYFAQMVKSDAHMQKVRDSLLQKKTGLEVSEKVKKMRQNRKMMKQLQVQSQLQRQKDKKDLMDEVKKYRKGLRKDLDFLEPGGDKKKPQPKPQQKPQPGPKNKKALEKRKYRDTKYGYGGKKRGLKTNTKESSADVAGYRPPTSGKRGNQRGNQKGKKQQQQKRPGKNRRSNIKSKRKK